MLTLLVTILATAYFVVPELLSRFVIGFFLVRKAMTSPKGEELMRASFWAIAPLVLAWFTRHILFWRMPQGTSSDLQVIFSSLYSDKYFADNRPDFFHSLLTFRDANLCLLSRAYFAVFVGSLLIGILARNFGRVRARVSAHTIISKILHWAILPRISEWHLALSPMLLQHPSSYCIEVDVMTKSGTLYRGTVHEKNIGADGSLQTLILGTPERFLYADFSRDRLAFEALADKQTSAKPQVQSYWRKIPGKMFLILGSDITSVNVRHVNTLSFVLPNEDPALHKVLNELKLLLANQSKS